jgi:hypothetical protein
MIHIFQYSNRNGNTTKYKFPIVTYTPDGGVIRRFQYITRIDESSWGSFDAWKRDANSMSTFKLEITL